VAAVPLKKSGGNLRSSGGYECGSGRGEEEAAAVEFFHGTEILAD